MMARGLRWMLLLEAAVYLALAGLWTVPGAGLAAMAAVAMAIALAMRTLVIAATYLIARSHRSPVPPSERIGLPAALAMALQELAAYVVVFSVVQPFERFFLGADRLQPGAATPVLLVHGYQCNRGFWLWQRSRLERAGFVVATLSLEPVFGSIDRYAAVIARRIDEVCAATGAGAVTLVGHSMGGLAARAYLRAHGTRRVSRLITLGTPHGGSVLARLALGENGGQMVPGNAWLDELNALGTAALPDDTVAIYSHYDNYVMPQDNGRLPGVRNRPCGAVGHLGMAVSTRITRLLLEELGRPLKAG